jgi:hypothetical protein
MHDRDIPVVTPIIHLNGDRKETLVARLETLDTLLRQAEEALTQCAPNGRNYYPEPGRFERAWAQHAARMALLARLRQSLDDEIVQIAAENP